MTDNKTATADERLRQEFNQWAEQGRGEEMEHHHISITEQTLALMDLKPGERVLDLGMRRRMGHAAHGADGRRGRAAGAGDRAGRLG